MILDKLNILGQCRKNGLRAWQCPQFLFLVMGVFIIIISLASYLIGVRYITDPLFITLIDIGITVVLITISFIITRSFERVAEASRMKSEFINIVSHQLRSPITNIKWITDFLSSDVIKMPTEKRNEYFDHLKENTNRMVELVDDLLIVSRIEEGRFPVKKKMSSFGEIIENMISRSKVYAQASNVKIQYRKDRNLPMAYFDPTLIKLVVENLVDNAIRYTKKGKIEVIARKEDNHIKCSVRDTGVGIPQEDQKFIFQKFFRSENALKEKTKGSGLGLYIAKSIISASGGRIWFESKEGKGTTFYFTIPIK